jgi:hypothetical protein
MVCFVDGGVGRTFKVPRGGGNGTDAYLLHWYSFHVPRAKVAQIVDALKCCVIFYRYSDSGWIDIARGNESPIDDENRFDGMVKWLAEDFLPVFGARVPTLQCMVAFKCGRMAAAIHYAASHGAEMTFGALAVWDEIMATRWKELAKPHPRQWKTFVVSDEDAGPSAR